jgi:hypothetical protein
MKPQMMWLYKHIRKAISPQEKLKIEKCKKVEKS